RYDGASQGGDVHPPGSLPQRDGGDCGDGPDPLQRLFVDTSHVSLQRLVLPLGRYRRGWAPCLSAEGPVQGGPPACGRGEGDPFVRRPYCDDQADYRSPFGLSLSPAVSDRDGGLSAAAGGDRPGGTDGGPGDPRVRPHRNLWSPHGLRVEGEMGR